MNLHPPASKEYLVGISVIVGLVAGVYGIQDHFKKRPHRVKKSPTTQPNSVANQS